MSDSVSQDGEVESRGPSSIAPQESQELVEPSWERIKTALAHTIGAKGAQPPATASPPDLAESTKPRPLELGPRRVVPHWCAWLLLALGFVTLPWIAGLAAALPSKAQAAHYDVSWAGFDILLSALLLRTGWLTLRNREDVGAPAAMTGILLVVDAWFDVMSAPTTGEFLTALAMALLVELPLAAFCLWLADRVESERRRRFARMRTLIHRVNTYRSRTR